MTELLQDSGPDMPKKKTFSELLDERDVARALKSRLTYSQANAAIDAYMERIETMCQQAQKVSFR